MISDNRNIYIFNILIAFVWLFNFFDAVFTWYWLNNGAEELNWIMKTLFDVHPILFFVCKIGFVTIFLIMLKRWLKEHFLARVGIVLCSVIYSFVILWHCCGAYYILGD
jgi:hypothetical protein